MTKGKKYFTPTLEELEEADESMYGFCRECGAARDCCEPDAQNYTCDNCGEDTVYGAAEYIIRGWVE